MTAQTCITNTGTTTLSGVFNIYTASTIGGPYGLGYSNISISNLTPPNCPYIFDVPNGTVQILLKDDNLSKCELLMNVQDSNVCTICNLGFSSGSTNTINEISVGNLTGSCSPMTDYRIYWYGPDSTTTLAYTSGFGTAFTPYTYTHPLIGSSAITGVTQGTYIPVIDKVKISGITYTQTGSSGAVTSCLTNCLNPITVRDPLSFQGIFAVTGGTPFSLPYVPPASAGIYSGTINWGDGFTSANTYANRTHTYAATSSYTITITGTITGWDYGTTFGNNTGATQIREVIRWGELRGRNNNNEGMFIGCTNLVLTGVTDILNMVGITSTRAMFNRCTSLTTISGINSWDMSSVTDFTEMFREARLFNNPLSGWNVSAATNMTSIFRGLNTNQMVFDQDLGNWNVSNVSGMSFMFSFCSGFTNGGSSSIGNWITSAVTNMNNMFFGASAFDQNLGNWNVSKVTNMFRMFRGAGNFNNGGSPSISGWTTSATTNMSEMFFGASNFDQPIGSWNVSNVISMNNMFYFATVFNQDIGSWNVSGVTNMFGMFYNATSFNQPLSGWNVKNVLSGTTNDGMRQMFQNATAFVQDISNWCVYPNQYSPTNTEPLNFSFGTSPSWLSSQQPVWSSTTIC